MIVTLPPTSGNRWSTFLSWRLSINKESFCVNIKNLSTANKYDTLKSQEDLLLVRNDVICEERSPSEILIIYRAPEIANKWAWELHWAELDNLWTKVLTNRSVLKKLDANDETKTKVFSLRGFIMHVIINSKW